MRTGSPRIHGLFWSTLCPVKPPVKGEGERSVCGCWDGVKRPLNERKENVWKGRKATRLPSVSLFLYGWRVFNQRTMVTLDCSGGRERRKNKTGMRREEEKYDGEKGGKVAGDCARGEEEVIIIWIALDRFHSQATCRPIDRRVELINLFKLDDALIDDHSTNTFYNSAVSFRSVVSHRVGHRTLLLYALRYADSLILSVFNLGARTCFTLLDTKRYWIWENNIFLSFFLSYLDIFTRVNIKLGFCKMISLGSNVWICGKFLQDSMNIG